MQNDSQLNKGLNKGLNKESNEPLKEQFKLLKEISSLFDQREILQDKVIKENLRVEKVIKQRQVREQEKLELQEQLKKASSQEQHIENCLAHSQGQLDQAKGHLNSVQTQQQIDALTSEISKLESDINQLEEEGIEILEKIDLLNKNIEEANSFLIGSEESLNEITHEVAEISDDFQKQIEILNQRIHSLTDELNPIFQNKLNTAINKKIPISIFSRISGGCCDFCKLQLSKVEVDNIERKLNLATCNGCSRIFIPLNSLY